MATSSRPFQSQTVARLVAGYRQVAHSAGRWLRQGRTAAVWGLQVAVYPLYAAVQGLRVGYRRLQAARPWQRAWARLTGQAPPMLAGADIPIRSLLSVLKPPVISSAMVRPSGLRLVNMYGRWLRQSGAGVVLTPGHWHLLRVQAPVRGIASDLSTRRLVLVLDDNGVFDGLTEDQQQRLQQAIVLMLAEYARGCRRSALDQALHQPWLPLPKTSSLVLPPLLWISQALRWMQTSDLAAATNLFGEASQQEATRAIALHNHTYRSDRAAHGPMPYPREMYPRAIAPRHLPSHSLPQPYHHPAFNPLPVPPPVGEAGTLVLTSSSAVAVAERPSGELTRHVAGVALEGRDSQGVLARVAIGSQLETSTPAEVAAAATVVAPPSPGALSAANHHQLEASSALEARVTQVNYIDPPLVAVLRGLDWVLYVLETWLRRLAAWLQRHW